MTPIRVRVLTINILGRQGDWESRRPVLIEGIRALAPDLVAIQESIVAEDFDQMADLFGGALHVAHHSSRAADGMGISIASRWPLGPIREIPFEVSARSRGYPVGLIAAEIAVPDPVGQLLFVNHFPSWQLDFALEREMQAVAAARFIQDLVGTRTMPIVLAGDLDADPAAASIRFWTGRQALDGMSICYRDAWEQVHPNEPGVTFTTANPLVAEFVPDWPFRRIDYILVRSAPGQRTPLVERCDVVLHEPVGGVWPSDHFGVLADLAWP